MAHRSFRFIGILLLFGFAVLGCSQNSQQGAAAGGRGGRGGRGGGAVVPTGTVSVETTKPQRISVERSVDLSGTMISPDQAHVSSEVAGKVMDVLIEIGQEVNTGQALVTLDTTELNLALERAESALRQTEAQLGINSEQPDRIPGDEDIAAVRTAAANRDDARAQLARAQELLSKGLMSKADMDTAQTRVKVTEAAYQAARENVASLKASLQDRRAAWDLAKKKLADATVRAPVPGAISERTVQRGEYIRENTQIATIVRMNPLKFRTAVQEKYANLIHQNQAVRFSVEAFPDETFTGKIAFISPAVDQASRTFAAEVLVENSSRKLKPGFFAQGHVGIGQDQVIAVPEETVSSLAGVSSVFVIRDSIVRQQTVEVGQKVDKLVEVLSGLKGDEIIAASNLNQLVTGVKIAANSGEEAGSASDEGGTPSDGRPAAGERGGRGRGGRRGGGE